MKSLSGSADLITAGCFIIFCPSPFFIFDIPRLLTQHSENHRALLLGIREGLARFGVEYILQVIQRREPLITKCGECSLDLSVHCGSCSQVIARVSYLGFRPVVGSAGASFNLAQNSSCSLR